jgi:hypothetical protein
VLRQSELVAWNGHILDSRTSLEPHTYYAQITFRGLREKDATVNLLDRWFRNKQYTLLFQTLAPLMDSYIGEKVHYTLPNLVDHCQNNIQFYLTHYWGNKVFVVSREFGNMFIVKWTLEQLRFNHEPKHIVFHAEHFKSHQWYYGNDRDTINYQRWADASPDPGIYLEQRQFVRLSSAMSDYTSTRVSSEFIYFGIRCMLELHKAGQYIWWSDENKKLWKTLFRPPRV